MVPNEPVLELHGLNLALWQLEPVLKHPFSLGSKANRCKCRLEKKTKALFSTSVCVELYQRLIELERTFILPLAPRWVRHSYLSKRYTQSPILVGYQNT
jgi:hypothetical protein